MSCNCKIAKNGKDIDESVIVSMEGKQLTFFTKLIIIFNFLEFYFYFVVTSVMNFIFFDKLEPNIPKRLLKRYKKYG